MKFNYESIDEFIAEIESLGDWRDPSQREKYLKVLGELIVVYNGYEKDGEGKYCSSKVYKALAAVCAKKFPKPDDVFEGSELKSEFKYDGEFISYLPYATSSSGIQFIGERGNVHQLLGRGEYGFIHEKMGENAEKFIKSAEDYYDKEVEKPGNRTLSEIKGLSEKEI